MRLIDADKLIDDYNKSDGTISDLMELILDAAGEVTLPNDPLTLEQLWEMDGDPVFIKRIGSDHPDDRAWALVDVEHELCKTVDGVKAFFEFFGKSWLAYRRKPEEG